MRSFKVKLICLVTGLTLLTVLLGVLAVGAWICLQNDDSLQLELNGSQEVTLELWQKYEDAGADAQYAGTLFPNVSENLIVEQTGAVDTSCIGSYLVQYSVDYMGYREMRCRTVQVVDTKAPVISLVTNPDSFTFPNEAYEEEGFIARDNYEGDISDRVVRVEKDGVVTYTVADSSGNKTSVTREIVYDDPIAPELTLLGDDAVSIYAGNAFEDPGYTAVDNCDGDITDLVSVTGNFDNRTPGIYHLTYTVEDSYGNVDCAERTVYVLPVPRSEPAANGGVIYLTFDDGPGPYTGKLLDILAQYGVKATFFVVNTGYIDMITRAAQEGHTVAIHTTTHKFDQIYASDEAYLNDVYTMQGIIASLTGQTPMLLRFPGGSSNTISRNYNAGIMTRMTQAVQALGFRYFDWNVDSRDAGGATSSDEVFFNVISGISRNGTSVVLQHDIAGFSVNAVERIIQWGLANGYTFAALSADSPGCHHGVLN